MERRHLHQQLMEEFNILGTQLLLYPRPHLVILQKFHLPQMLLLLKIIIISHTNNPHHQVFTFLSKMKCKKNSSALFLLSPVPSPDSAESKLHASQAGIFILSLLRKLVQSTVGDSVAMVNSELERKQTHLSQKSWIQLISSRCKWSLFIADRTTPLLLLRVVLLCGCGETIVTASVVFRLLIKF